MKFHPLGDAAVRVDFGSGAAALARAVQFSHGWQSVRPDGIHDVVTAYAQVAIHYEPIKFSGAGNSPHAQVCALITAAAKKSGRSRLPALRRKRTAPIEIPICSEEAYAPDLVAWSTHCKMAPERVLKLYFAATYTVAAIGFAPGFPYLLGLPPKLAMPRRLTPRSAVPAGSVGIGGAQTGIYPFATPGGWNLIGRTPVEIFNVTREAPSRLQVGDQVKFQPISTAEFQAWR